MDSSNYSVFALGYSGMVGGMDKMAVEQLELIRIHWNKDTYYWHLDCEGLYLNSIVYNSKEEALEALAKQKIEWECIDQCISIMKD